VPLGPAEMMNNYQRLVRTAEVPVLDTSCAAVMLMAEQVHERGYKVVLTGEGADEWLAGYSWYKVNRLLGMADFVPAFRLGNVARRMFLRCVGAPPETWQLAKKAQATVGGPNAWTDLYSLMSLPRLRLFRPELREALADHDPYADLVLDQERLRRWHPLNRGLSVGAQVMLPGMLLCSKGDRVAMHSSVEARYPFLDEEVYSYLARLHPSWKLRGWTEKYLLRKVAERWLPHSIAWRRKAPFRAPLDPFLRDTAPPFIERLLSEESLRQSGYFEPSAVRHWRDTTKHLRQSSFTHLAMSAGLAGVVATQMWHQEFIDPGLGQ
jgi:asparagine synthase (glutamine-hydrolysing)